MGKSFQIGLAEGMPVNGFYVSCVNLDGCIRKHRMLPWIQMPLPNIHEGKLHRKL
jgi:hypothetical protein